MIKSCRIHRQFYRLYYTGPSFFFGLQDHVNGCEYPAFGCRRTTDSVVARLGRVLEKTPPFNSSLCVFLEHDGGAQSSASPMTDVVSRQSDNRDMP
jgi:hypothetical protein